MTRTDTEPATLADQATAAFEASRLEAAAGAEQQASAERNRMVADAARSLVEAFGDGWTITGDTPLDDRTVTAEVAGVELVYDRRYPGLRGAIACPLCGHPSGVTTARVNNLERLGQLIVAPATFELVTHVTADGDDCDGIERTPRVETRQPWRARYAATTDSVQDKLNDLDAAGYGNPIIVASEVGGWIVVGHARTPRDPDDPF